MAGPRPHRHGWDSDPDFPVLKSVLQSVLFCFADDYGIINMHAKINYYIIPIPCVGFPKDRKSEEETMMK